VYWATPENIYYGPSSGVTGTLSAPFNATEFFQKGGGILWIGSHTTNTGQGLLDYFVVVSTEGEILCYAGTSPESSTWSLASRFIIGKPAGPRAFLNYEADLLIVSENGLISLNRLINKAEDVSKYGSKIGPYMSALSSTMPSHYWQPVAFPEEEILLVNTHNEALVEAGFGGTLTGGVSPYVATPQYGYLKPTYWNDSSYNYSTQQLVMVNQTGSTAKKWTVFQGWESFCYAAIGRHLYYGSIGGLVCRAFYTGADMGKDIPLFMSCSFNYFKNKMQVKRFTGVRPLWNTSGRIRYGWGLEADYRNVPSDAARDLGVGTNGFTFPFLFPIQFGTEMRHYSNRYSVKGNGRAGSVRFFGQGRNINIEISAIHVFFETGGVL
jgi:hypothetical protein